MKDVLRGLVDEIQYHTHLCLLYRITFKQSIGFSQRSSDLSIGHRTLSFPTLMGWAMVA
jgi:hypothetical protein